MTVSFIHAADFHIGADLRRFGRARRQLEQAQLLALEKTLAAADERKAWFILISGDLFDSRKPSASVLEQTASTFRGFPHITVYVIPGTHDFLSEDSPLSPARARWAPGNVHILNDLRQSPLHIEPCNAHLYFRPNTSNRSTQSPIAGLARAGNAGVHIALAHGSLSPGKLSETDFPIDPADIKNSGLEYLALGHWHKPRVENFGDTVAAYPGIPQPLSFSDPETGSIFFVQCTPGEKCTPDRIETSAIRLKKVSGRIFHPQDLKMLLDTVPDPNTILKLDVHFSDNCIERLEVDEIIEYAKSRYILVQEENQQNSQPVSPPPVTGEVNRELIDAYQAELDRLRQGDSPERADIYKKALELGTKIIKGDV